MTRTKTASALAVTAVLVLCVAACSSEASDPSSATTTTVTASTIAPDSNRVTDLVLDPDHDYGDKYANGILPVGDGRYVTDGPKAGSVYLCHEPMTGGGGAMERGPWFINDNTEYDSSEKVAVEGEVTWDGTYSMDVQGTGRVITTNDLPDDHTTGDFPIQASDPAYQYDRNPNSIAAQSLTYALTAAPEVGDAPTCIGGEVGVMTTGVALFDAFDIGGRDAGAWEVQDGCDGHPQMSSEYHYHTLSKCIEDATVEEIIGWALDGFPITGPKVGDDNVLTTSDLDECHGITSTLKIDAKLVTTYHYVMTQDFPYSASCFRSTPIQPPRPG